MVSAPTPPWEDPLMAVQMMNTCDIPVVSADIASGVEADTGWVPGGRGARRCDGDLLPAQGRAFSGRGRSAHRPAHGGRRIGIPLDLVLWTESNFYSVCENDVYLPRRERDAHKGNFGRDYILGGSVGYTGAPVLAARAALRAGAGLVSVGVPEPIWPVVAMKLDEAMPSPLPAGKTGMLSLEAAEQILARMNASDVCLIGPGLGRGNGVASVVRHLLRRRPCRRDTGRGRHKCAGRAYRCVGGPAGRGHHPDAP